MPHFPTPSVVPTTVALPEPVSAISAGRRHACALTEEGTAYCWGFNVDGETGNGTSGVEASVVTVPAKVVGGLKLSAISAGLDFTCALTVFGEPYCWGSNVDGIVGEFASERCGDVAPVPCESKPTRVATSFVFQEIAAGGNHACGRTAGGVVACWGSNGQGQLGSAGPEGKGKSFAPRRVFLQNAPPFSSISSGGIHSCALTEAGPLYCWGSDTGAQLGSFRNLEAQDTPIRSQWKFAFIAVSAGGYHTCGLVEDGTLYCWGDNDTGALGKD